MTKDLAEAVADAVAQQKPRAKSPVQAGFEKSLEDRAREEREVAEFRADERKRWAGR